MQRRRLAVVAFLCTTLGLSGCGNALKLDAGKPASQGLPTATPEVLAQATAAPGVGTDGSATDVVTDAQVPAAPVDSPLPSAAPESPPPPPPEPLPSPTVNPEFTGVQFPDTEARWRYVQVNRTVLEGGQTYTTPSRQLLWWYDPVFGQPVKLGEIQGDFLVQATFRFRGQEVEALEIPYQVNQSFGITLPAAVGERIKRAGYGEWIEAFVYKTDDIRPK